jgi:hypothetical protein
MFGDCPWAIAARHVCTININIAALLLTLMLMLAARIFKSQKPNPEF